MLQKFNQYIKEQVLFNPLDDALLLAVSGGIDSMAMVHLCQQKRLRFGIAHCNFSLRGADADADELLVKNLALRLNVPFFCIRFETKKEAQKQKMSIQMVARKLRYDWLESIRQQEKYHYIALGQHSNDATETLLLNLTKGCGIKGLHGILPKRNKLIRPLLFATKAEITAYVQQQHITYREDSSNQNTKYIRNRLRHRVVPVLQEINPNLEQTMLHNFKRFRETENLYNFAIDYFKKIVVQKEKDYQTIAIRTLLESPAPLSLLYEILQPLGFGIALVENILGQALQDKGAIYTTDSHRVIKDKNKWLIGAISPPFAPITLLPNQQSTLFDNQKIHWQILTKKEVKNWLSSSKKEAFFDADTIKFPLKIRTYQTGDIFEPLGMNGQSKKLSKYLKDCRLNLLEKEKIRVLCNADQKIIWVIGQREDERFKIKNSTQNIFKISVE